jgi:hypothetical protein
MTTYVSARDTLVAHINTSLSAALPDLKVFYENTLSVDPDTVGDSFMKVTIEFTDSIQSDIDMDMNDMTVLPGDQTFGEVNFRLFVKEGTGVRTTLAIFDIIKTMMKFKILGGVSAGVPTPGKKKSVSGWVSHDIDVPFSFYSKF